MEPLQSWLDAKAVRRMAEDLMAPAPEVEEPTVDAGYGDAFEGFAAATSEVETATPPAATPPAATPPAATPPVATPPVATPPPAKDEPKPAFQPAMNLAQESPAIESEADSDASVEFDDARPPAESSEIEGGSAAARPQVEVRGPFLSRVQQFSETIRRHLGAQAMFLIDDEGQIILDELGNTKLVQVARNLANASHRASRQTAGAVTVGNLHIKIGASETLEVIPVQSCYGLLILGVIFPAPIGAAVIQVAEELSRIVEPD